MSAIQRSDLISDEALAYPKKMSKEIKRALKANRKLIKSTKKLTKATKKLQELKNK